MSHSKHISKQGISPLIATVLIIAFTVALAVIVINWGTSFTRDLQDNTSNSADFQISCAQEVVYSIKSACVTTGGALNVVVSNDGSKALDQVIVRTTSLNSAATQQYTTSPSSVPPVNPPVAAEFAEVTVVVPAGSFPTPAAKVEVIPYITAGNGDSQPCSSNKRTFGVETTALAAC